MNARDGDPTLVWVVAVRSLWVLFGVIICTGWHRKP